MDPSKFVDLTLSDDGREEEKETLEPVGVNICPDIVDMEDYESDDETLHNRIVIDSRHDLVAEKVIDKQVARLQAAPEPLLSLKQNEIVETRMNIYDSPRTNGKTLHRNESVFQRKRGKARCGKASGSLTKTVRTQPYSARKKNRDSDEGTANPSLSTWNQLGKKRKRQNGPNPELKNFETKRAKSIPSTQGEVIHIDSNFEYETQTRRETILPSDFGRSNKDEDSPGGVYGSQLLVQAKKRAAARLEGETKHLKRAPLLITTTALRDSHFKPDETDLERRLAAATNEQLTKEDSNNITRISDKERVNDELNTTAFRESAAIGYKMQLVLNDNNVVCKQNLNSPPITTEANKDNAITFHGSWCATAMHDAELASKSDENGVDSVTNFMYKQEPFGVIGTGPRSELMKDVVEKKFELSKQSTSRVEFKSELTSRLAEVYEAVKQEKVSATDEKKPLNPVAASSACPKTVESWKHVSSVDTKEDLISTANFLESATFSSCRNFIFIDDSSDDESDNECIYVKTEANVTRKSTAARAKKGRVKSDDSTRTRPVHRTKPQPRPCKPPGWNMDISEEQALEMQERLFRESAARVRAKVNCFVQAGVFGSDDPRSLPSPCAEIYRTYPDHWKWKNLYARLGLPNRSSVSLVRSHYRKLALLYHPDKRKYDDSAERFHAITAAYKKLSKG